MICRADIHSITINSVWCCRNSALNREAQPTLLDHHFEATANKPPHSGRGGRPGTRIHGGTTPHCRRCVVLCCVVLCCAVLCCVVLPVARDVSRRSRARDAIPPRAAGRWRPPAATTAPSSRASWRSAAGTRTARTRRSYGGWCPPGPPGRLSGVPSPPRDCHRPTVGFAGAGQVSSTSRRTVPGNNAGPGLLAAARAEPVSPAPSSSQPRASRNLEQGRRIADAYCTRAAFSRWHRQPTHSA